MSMTELERRCVDALAKAQGLEPHEIAALPISTATGNLLDEVRAVLAEAGVAEMQARITKLEEALYACRRAVAGRQDDPRRKVRAIVLVAFGGDPDEAWPKDYEATQ